MANITFRALEEYELKLSDLSSGSEEIAKKAIYKGAGIAADAVKAGLKSIPTIQNQQFASNENPVSGLTRIQKYDVIEGFGITPLAHENGYYNVKLGFDGYGSAPTKKYPKGVPNQLLMRSVESGTSFRKKTPVIRRSVASVKTKVVQAMNETIEEEVNKIMK